MFKKTLSFIVLAATAAAFTLTSLNSYAGEGQITNLVPQAKRSLVESLNKILPAYIKAVAQVLKETDALPAGTVQESTRLDQIPIPNLFEKHNAALGKVLIDVAFNEGRNEEDIAWLRASLVDLKALLAAVKKAKSRANADQEISKYVFVVRNFVKSAQEYEVQVLLNPASRFYCNIDIQINRAKSKSRPTVEASETCD